MAKKKTVAENPSPPNSEVTIDNDTGDEASEIIGDQPSVSEHAISAVGESTVTEATGEDTQPPSSDGEKDAAGEVWNASVHSANKQKTRTGHWRRKRGAGANTTSRVILPDQKAKLAAEAGETAKNNANMAGAAAANSIFLLGTMFGGEEWRPITIDEKGLSFAPVDEKAMMQEAFANYMLAKGVTDFPPGLTLTMALMSYIAPRLTMPRTKERMKGMKGWLALRLAKRRIKKAFKKNGIEAEVSIDGNRLLINGKEYDGSRFNFGDNSQRQNVQGKEAGEVIQGERAGGDRIRPAT